MKCKTAEGKKTITHFTIHISYIYEDIFLKNIKNKRIKCLGLNKKTAFDMCKIY